MKTTALIGAAIAACAIAAPARAASDYLLEMGGVEGEAGEPAAVAAWSFGVCNSGQCGPTSPRREVTSAPALPKSTLTASQNSQSLRKAGRAASGGEAGPASSTATGDLDGDGRADLAYAMQQAEIAGLTMVFDKSSPILAKVCMGKHIAKATLRGANDSFDIVDASVSCASPMAVADRRIDAEPGRMSTNVTVPKQTQGATFGERCAGATCPVDGQVAMTITGGQMRHTKTGHVTLLK